MIPEQVIRLEVSAVTPDELGVRGKLKPERRKIDLKQVMLLFWNMYG